MIDTARDEEADPPGIGYNEPGGYYQKNPSALDARYSRLHCRCMVTEGADRLERSLSLLENLTHEGRLKSAVQQAQTVCRDLRAQYKVELEKRSEQHTAEMIELSKLYVINPVEGNSVQTSAWEQGAFRKLRTPVRKETKKKRIAGKRRSVIQNAQKATTVLKEKKKK